MTDLVSLGAVIYVGKQILGKTFDKVGSDLATLYEKGRDKIIEKAKQKISNINDGKTANLRVSRDVFWNGSFTDENICAEYFGGILASSRSENGQDDTGIYFVDIVRSLSSKQLLLHYLIYNSLNKFFINSDKKDLNPAQENIIGSENIFLSTIQLDRIIGEEIGLHLHALFAKKLIGNFQTGVDKNSKGLFVPNLKVSPSTVGIQLYAASHNKLDKWRNFAFEDFGVFSEVKENINYFKSIEDF